MYCHKMHCVNALSEKSKLFDSTDYSCLYLTPIDTRGHRINRYCDIAGFDWSFGVDRYVRDRTFDQMRRDFYCNVYRDCCMGHVEDSYGRNRKELRVMNNELNQLFCDRKNGCKLMDLVQKYVWEERWNKIPNALRLDVKNARLVGYYDGNSKTLVAEDDKYFYVAHYSGS